MSVERFITRKKNSKKGILYLVKWNDSPITDSTWEPEINLDKQPLSLFFPLQIDLFRLQAVACVFEDAIQERLKPGMRRAESVIKFDHDIYRYCFETEKEVLIGSADDLLKLPLSSHWYYRIDQQGYGLQIDFPMRLTPKLKMRKTFIKEKGQILTKIKPVETIEIVTATCVDPIEH